MSTFTDLVEERCQQFKRRQVDGALMCSKRTAEVMRVLITTQKHTDAAALIDDVRWVGRKLQAARPVELSIGNMVKRVLHMIREEGDQDASEMIPPVDNVEKVVQQPMGLLSQALHTHSSRGFNRAFSLSSLLDQGAELAVASAAPQPAAVAPTLPPIKSSPRRRQSLEEERAKEESASVAEAPDAPDVRRRGKTPQKGPQWRGKHNVIEQINELIDELDNMHTQIAQAAIEHIHANEVILTIGFSTTVALFLREAAKQRDFQVVVAEGSPACSGQKMARQLAEAGLQTTFIPDSNIFALMSRVNKVFVGAHAILADGGVVGRVGTHLAAMIAKRFAVPFVVLVGLHKLSCQFPQDPDTVHNELTEPEDVVDYGIEAEAFFLSNKDQDCTLHLPNPSFDYVPPNLIDLLVTDTGGYTPSYVYRLLAEYYSREDYFIGTESKS